MLGTRYLEIHPQRSPRYWECDIFQKFSKHFDNFWKDNALWKTYFGTSVNQAFADAAFRATFIILGFVYLCFSLLYSILMSALFYFSLFFIIILSFYFILFKTLGTWPYFIMWFNFFKPLKHVKRFKPTINFQL